MATTLADFAALAARCRDMPALGLHAFLIDESVQRLEWPPDVVEQLLYDFADRFEFQRDYGHIDLEAVCWHDEIVPTAAFMSMPTGSSEAGLIEYFAADPAHWSEVRRSQGVPQHWQAFGTWLRRPLVIDQALITEGGTGLQVIEGRTRVGVLRGFVRQGQEVAQAHASWVARACRCDRH